LPSAERIAAARAESFLIRVQPTVRRPGADRAWFPRATSRHVVATSGAKDLLLRSTFDNSRLVRLLDGWAPAQVEASGMDFAERMSLWFNAFDAIRLSAVHQSSRTDAAAAGTPRTNSPAPRVRAAGEELRQARATLAKAIAQVVDTDASDPGYLPYKRRHLELQRRMELLIPPLRDHLRSALASASPRLRQLAELDAVLEQVVAPREQSLLPTVAGFLEQRFNQLRQGHASSSDGDKAWLRTFEQDWRDALLAELDLRLQPVTGLLEALTNESNIEH
jgi:hypothetical protein